MTKKKTSLMTTHKQIFMTFLALIASVLFFSFTQTDLWVEDMFFNTSTQEWILDRNLEPYKFIFYDGIKKLLILFAVSLLIALIFFRKSNFVQTYKKGILIVVLSAIFVPLVVGGLKKYTNMPCPKNMVHYGGVYPDTKVWEHYPKKFKQNANIRCFPAGHASGGFTLLSLFFLFQRKQNRVMAIFFALGIGWSMGLYKMLIGDHFLSHTVITMILAWLIILIIHRSFIRS